MIQKLRKLGVGAHVGGVYMGVVCYADDVLLIASTRQAMEQMLRVVEKFAADSNVKFSTDPNPAKSKSKCILMVGKKKREVKPVPLQLCGSDLPWVSTAEHLGHTLHESGTMEQDAKGKESKVHKRHS